METLSPLPCIPLLPWLIAVCSHDRQIGFWNRAIYDRRSTPQSCAPHPALLAAVEWLASYAAHSRRTLRVREKVVRIPNAELSATVSPTVLEEFVQPMPGQSWWMEVNGMVTADTKKLRSGWLRSYES